MIQQFNRVRAFSEQSTHLLEEEEQWTTLGLYSPITLSFSGYFQKARVLPSSTTHLLCHAPNPDTSSNMVKKPLFDTYKKY